MAIATTVKPKKSFQNQTKLRSNLHFNPDNPDQSSVTNKIKELKQNTIIHARQ